MKKEILFHSDWIVYEDNLARRIVLLRWYNKDNEIFQHTVGYQTEDISEKNWMNPIRPNFHWNKYFPMTTKLTQEMLDLFGEKVHEFFHRSKNQLTLATKKTDK